MNTVLFIQLLTITLTSIFGVYKICDYYFKMLFNNQTIDHILITRFISVMVTILWSIQLIAFIIN